MGNEKTAVFHYDPFPPTRKVATAGGSQLAIWNLLSQMYPYERIRIPIGEVGCFSIRNSQYPYSTKKEERTLRSSFLVLFPSPQEG